MEKGGLAKRSSPARQVQRDGVIPAQEACPSVRKRPFPAKAASNCNSPHSREKGDRLSFFRPRLCHLRKQQCYLSSRRRQSGEVQPHRILHLSDCDGARIVNMNLTFRNADTPAKKGYNQPSGSHLINLINKEWNQCFLEIDRISATR